MREEDFKIVLSEWKTSSLPELIERELALPLDISLIISLIGPRQAGKTYRMFQLINNLTSKIPKNNILYVNFEHERLRNLDAIHLEEMMKVFFQLFFPNESFPIYLILDEIQNVRDWDKWVRRIHDSPKYRIYITGSSSKLSSKEIATSLRGRSISYTIFPFSFREFLRANNFEVKELDTLPYLEERGKILALIDEYIKFGGYPKVVLIKDEKLKEKLLLSYYEAIFYKDLIERYKPDPTLLDAFLRYCINNYSSLISISKAYKYLKSLGLKCSKQTLIKYLTYAGNVFLIFPVEIFSYSIKQRKIYPKKIYIVDNGLIRVLTGEIKIGKLMENVVAVEIIRRLQELTQIAYWKEYGKRDGSEVDFVILKNNKPVKLIQVTYASNKEEIDKRELNALIKASEELNCNDLQIITWDYEGEIELKSCIIKCIPLWKWLLKSEII